MNRACACGAIAEVDDDGQFKGGVSHGAYLCIGPGVEVHAPDCWHIHHDCAVAAIQRVRDVCDKRMDLADATIAWEGGFIEGWNHALDRLCDALDGPA